MAVYYRTQGFVLKKEDVREADHLFSVYTEDFGKLEILGKAIRKIKSKLRAGTDLFYLSEIEFIQGKNYKTLTDAITINKFAEIRKNLDKLEIVSQITEAADNLIKGEEKDDKIWGLLNEVFNKLNEGAKLAQKELSSPSKKAVNLVPSFQELLYHYFIWNLLSVLGYQIDLYHCVKCQEKLIPGLMNFSSENNGIICLRCSDDSTKDKILISPGTIKILRLFLKNDWKILSRLKITNSHSKELESISQSVIINT